MEYARTGPGKKNNGHDDPVPTTSDNPVEPADPGYPEGVSTVAGAVADELKEDMI